MLYVLPETTGDIIVLQASGTLTTADYKETFIPLFDHVNTTHPEVRLVIFFAPGFEGIEAGVIWEDTKFGLQHANDLHKLAVIGGPEWLDWASRVANHLTKGEVRHYKITQMLQAMHWINDDEDEDASTRYPFGG